MNHRSIAVIVIALGVVASIGLLGAGLAAGPLSTVLGAEDRQPPALLSFDTAGPHCTDDHTANSSTSIRGGGPNTEITYIRNISLPSRAHAVGGPTFEQLDESTYLLSVPAEATSTTAACTGDSRSETSVRYNASMRIPAGEDPWRVIIQHDGRNVTTIHGDSESSLTGGSASGGGNVSS